ncbi:MAG: hypothetical protein K0Q51_142 [Rickettsiaceae bacterium]|jgi:hypothetical protein|nr:hypothetical protein [Rickettsiaceae bacterium]
MKRIILLTVNILLLASCSTYHNDFTCKAEKGERCYNMTQVKESIENERGKRKDASKVVYNTKSLESFGGQVNANILGGKLARRPERIMKIWFTPHVDKDNNFVTDRYVYTVIQNSEWVMR